MLSEKMENFLEILKRFQEENGYTPTVRELAEAEELKSPATVKYYLDKLERSGKIKRVNNRKIEIVEEK